MFASASEWAIIVFRSFRTAWWTSISFEFSCFRTLPGIRLWASSPLLSRKGLEYATIGHIQGDHEVTILSRIVPVEVSFEEEGSNLMRLLEVLVRNEDPVEQSQLFELFVTEAQFLLNAYDNA
jgi:hypothetical protein